MDDWQADSSLFAYLPDDALFIIDERIHETQADYWSQIQRRYEERRHDIDKPIVAPELLYLLSNTLNEHLNHYPRVMLSAHEKRAAIDNDASSTAQAASNRQGLVTLTAQQPPQLAVNHQKAEPLADLLEFLLQQAQTATPVLIVAETDT